MYYSVQMARQSFKDILDAFLFILTMLLEGISLCMYRKDAWYI